MVTSAVRMSPIWALPSGLGTTWPCGRQQAALLLGHVLVGEGVDGALQLQALVVGQVELRPDLDLELVDERPLVRQLDRGGVDVGLS